MAFPEDSVFYSERGAYTRAWLTHGMIEAGYAGHAEAFELLRANYDRFNQAKFLPELLRGAVQGGQGMIANTRMYFTPKGKPADIQLIQRYFLEEPVARGVSPPRQGPDMAVSLRPAALLFADQPRSLYGCVPGDGR